MNLYFRLFWLLLQGLLRPTRARWHESTRVEMRVLPTDLDLNLHLNNGRYLTLMDLGRLDYMRQTGLLLTCLRRKWLPVLGAAQMIYLRPLHVLQRFHIETRMEYWDDKWFVMSQRFLSQGKLIAAGRVRGLMRGPEGNISPARILESAGIVGAQSPPLNDELEHWLASLKV